MSEPFHTRAAEIIAAYGADPARWPDAERATALHVVAASPALRAALAAARMLDADLVRWAQAPVAGGDPARAAAAAMRPRRIFVRWAAGGTALAASLVAGLLLLLPHPGAVPVRQAVPVAASDDAAAFAQVFTPTPDEEQVL